jgi:type I restriction enzyme M protein
MTNNSENVNFIWEIANLLRDTYKRHQYGQVIIPFVVLRRFDCILEETKEEVFKYYKENPTTRDWTLNKISKLNFHNKSEFNFQKLLSDSNNLLENLQDYMNGFSENVREIFENFESFKIDLVKLDKADLLYDLIKKFSTRDFHINIISNNSMGYIFEEILRKSFESRNEEAGEHYTPREVIKLIVNLLFCEDTSSLSKENQIKKIYDCACGTGGMLTTSENYLKKLNPSIELHLYGQELQRETYAICKADLLMKGAKENFENIHLGNTLTNDKFEDEKFDYMVVNPPFGSKWKGKQQEIIKAEFNDLGFKGRFGAGTPSISDAQLLFMQHLISKMKKEGSKIGLVSNGSPLFSGGAGGGESNIRKWILENDYLETIVCLPNQLFYNTGINTYIWILSNNKIDKRKNKVQLIDARSYSKKLQKSLGKKRNEITKEQIEEITEIFGNFKETENSKIFDNEDFLYNKVSLDLKDFDEEGKPIKVKDTERIPLKQNVEEYLKKEVELEYKETKRVVGCEINFTQYFYKYEKLRETQEIKKNIENLEKENNEILKELKL